LKLKPAKIIHYTSSFRRAYKKLSLKDKLQAEKREKVFRKNIFDSQLKTHKLKGKLKNRWSFSVTRSYRILFNSTTKNKVVFYDIGNHQIYQ